MQKINENFSGVCVSCGAPVPEGRMICPTCEKQISEQTVSFKNSVKTEKENKSTVWKGGRVK